MSSDGVRSVGFSIGQSPNLCSAYSATHFAARRKLKLSCLNWQICEQLPAELTGALPQLKIGCYVVDLAKDPNTWGAT